MNIILFFLFILNSAFGKPKLVFNDHLDSSIKEMLFEDADIIAIKKNGVVISREFKGKNTKNKNSIFDIASLSKIFTGLSVLKLIEKNQLNLDQTLEEIIEPHLIPENKRKITIDQLLRHQAGLIPSVKSEDLVIGSPKLTIKNILKYKLWNVPGEKFIYSDTGYILLGRIIEVISKKTLKEFIVENIINPLELVKTTFHKVKKENQDQLIPSHHEANKLLVHDPIAKKYPGAPGHAGLFSSIKDLTILMLAIMNKSDKLFDQDSYDLLFQTGSLGLRGIGFDINSRFSLSLKGDCFSNNSISHSGFTGTSIIYDPSKEVTLIILTNRTRGQLPHKESIQKMKVFRQNIANKVCESIN